ncbi:MAG TPA: metallopeptidase TldD-related protein [Acidobacteriota bacterium]|nr:metallopeptidase TldD-related protein [Acidobacteriota bacterium]
MTAISRRSFLKTGAATAAITVATPIIVDTAWLVAAGTDAPGYFEREFGISDAACRRILAEALSRGGDFADLYFEHTISNYLILEDGKVNRAISEIALGVGIRTVKGEQVGYGFTQELTEKSMSAAAATAATIASAAAKAPSRTFTRLETGNFYPLKTLYSEIPVEPKLALVQSLNDRCRMLSMRVVTVNATYHDQQKRILVVSSDGVKAEDLLPNAYLAVGVVVEKDGRRERSSWSFGGRRDFSFFTPDIVEEAARRAVERTLVLFDAVQPPAGEMPVVLGPGATGILLHEAIGHGMEADFNRKKISAYSEMIGKKVAEPFVTIVDDGTIPGQPGSINVDDEGVKGQKTVLVEKGILKSYLHDRISARYFGCEPTGNGRRESYQHFPLPRMRNTYMEAGPAAPEDVIRAAGNGIYVEDVTSGQVKIGEGDFAFFVSQGRMIEDGKLGAPIKDVNIMGNGPRMLADTVIAASDFELDRKGTSSCGKGGQSVPVGVGQPTMLVKSLIVGGTRS